MKILRLELGFGTMIEFGKLEKRAGCCVPYVMSGSLLIISLQREENKEDSLR